MPSVALRELERDRELVFEILDMRAYAHIKQAIERAKSEDDIPKSPMVEIVADNMIELMKEGTESPETHG